jgi:CheY-like chemotaxis protein
MILRILVAEGYPAGADSTATLLRTWGHEVKVAADGPSALLAAQTYQPDVIVLDIDLPDMGGWKVAKLLHEQATGNRPLLLAVTGYGPGCDTQHSSDSGVDLHLIKPLDPDELRLLLDNWQAILASQALALTCVA